MLQPIPRGDQNNYQPNAEHLRAELEDALANDVRVDEQGINIDLVAGTVYLTGIIPSYYQKRIAGQLAARIKGVLDVSNELIVRPVSGCSDDQIALAV
jgi:osmotically-inducible protein OsmY